MIRILFLALIFSVFSITTSDAQIAGPIACDAAAEGKIIYNADHKVPQYCDGADWIAMTGGGGGGGGATEEVIYDGPITASPTNIATPLKIGDVIEFEGVVGSGTSFVQNCQHQISFNGGASWERMVFLSGGPASLSYPVLGGGSNRGRYAVVIKSTGNIPGSGLFLTAATYRTESATTVSAPESIAGLYPGFIQIQRTGTACTGTNTVKLTKVSD